MAIPNPSLVFPGGTSWLVQVYFRSLSCRNIQPLFNFNGWIDLWTLASRIYWYLVESILPSTRIIFPVATTPKHNGLTSMFHSWRCVLLHEGFSLVSKNTFFGRGQKVQFWFRQSKAHCSKKASSFLMFSFSYFKRLILCWGHSFWQIYHGGISCFKYIVLLSCEQLTCVCYSFSVMCGFLWAFLIKSQVIRSEIFFGLPDLALQSCSFIFHFLIMFLIVEIGSLKH